MKSLVEFLIDNVISILFLLAIGVVFYQIALREKQHKKAKQKLKKAIESKLDEPVTLHPEIDPELCAGCGTCTRSCPEGDILSLINHRAALVSPSKCVGHGECERVCPMNAISLVFGTKTRGMDIPRLTRDYETNVPGLYIAGELGGMGLIRNAVKQGFLAASHAINHLKEGTETTDYDVIIVGAGPAGLSASLTAIANKKKYLCIEQNSFGGTVYNFPRQKIVMSHPLQLPIVGLKKFDSNKTSKETLLAYWNEVKNKTGFKVTENTKFEALEKVGNIFKVTHSSAGNTVTHTAKNVILCMGVRGSPRRLGVQGENSSKVTYNLLDPEQYQNKSIVVVGGGNAGVEAAQMLSSEKYKNKVHLLIRGDKFDRCNEENINKITSMKNKQLLEIWFNASISEILADKVHVKVKEDNVILKNDYVFVFAGAEMPHKFLMSLGVKIDKKFGEGLTA